MKYSTIHFLSIVVLMMGYCSAPPVSAQDVTTADEIYETPIVLATLAGPDGLEGIACDYYLHVQTPDGDAVVHTQIETDGENIIFTSHHAMSDGGTMTERCVFSSDGEYIESSDVFQIQDLRSESRRVRDGDVIRSTRAFSMGIGPSEEEQDAYEYEFPVDAIPRVWMNIAYAYHVRQGHETFTIKNSGDPGGQGAHAQLFMIEVIGQDRIDYQGAQVETHVLLETEISEGDVESDDSAHMVMHVLPSGEIIRMHGDIRGATMNAESVTAEEAEELFASWNDEAGSEIPPE